MLLSIEDLTSPQLGRDPSPSLSRTGILTLRLGRPFCIACVSKRRYVFVCWRAGLLLVHLPLLEARQFLACGAHDGIGWGDVGLALLARNYIDVSDSPISSDRSSEKQSWTPLGRNCGKVFVPVVRLHLVLEHLAVEVHALRLALHLVLRTLGYEWVWLRRRLAWGVGVAVGKDLGGHCRGWFRLVSFLEL